jgi:hypothetical protein
MGSQMDNNNNNNNKLITVTETVQSRVLIVNPFLFVWFCWEWGLNSGLHACKVGTLLLEPHLQSILP